jgi:hypothetical protein
LNSSGVTRSSFFSTSSDRLARRQPGPVAEAEDMRVDGDGRLAEGRVEHDIGRLAPDTGQRFERRALGGHFAAMQFDQHPAGGDDVLRLGAKEADGLDVFESALPRPAPASPPASGGRKQPRRRLVDADVGRLRRQ